MSDEDRKSRSDALYSKVVRRMWRDAKFRRLSSPPPSGKFLWLYLLTCPESTVIPGLIPIGEAALAENLGWPLEGLRYAFAEVMREGLAYADWDARLVWIPNAIKRNEPQSINVVKGWVGSWDELPECDLRNTAAAHIAEYLKDKGSAWFEAFRKAYVMPSPMPNAMPNAKAWAIQEQEQEQEQEENNSRDASPSLPSAPPPAPPAASPSSESEPTPAETIRELGAKYPAEVLAESREGCAMTRRNGKLADAVWARTLRQLEAYPLEAVVAALETFVARYADGTKDERYLVGIARGNAKGASAVTRLSSRGPVRPAREEDFRDDDPNEVWGEVIHG